MASKEERISDLAKLQDEIKVGIKEGYNSPSKDQASINVLRICIKTSIEFSKFVMLKNSEDGGGNRTDGEWFSWYLEEKRLGKF